MSQINCHTCGARTNSLIANCEYCGVELARTHQTSPKELVEAIVRSIDKYEANKRMEMDKNFWLISKDQVRAEAISMIPLPSDTLSLIEVFLFCRGNITGEKPGMFDRLPLRAWRAKADAAYSRLRLAAANDPQVRVFLEDFKQSHSAASTPDTAASGMSALIGGAGTAAGGMVKAAGDALTDRIKSGPSKEEKTLVEKFVFKGVKYCFIFMLFSLGLPLLFLLLAKLLDLLF